MGKFTGFINKLKNKSDSQNNAGEIAQNVAKEGTKKFFLNPLIWKGLFLGLITLLIFVFFTVIISAVVTVFTYDTFDHENGKMSSLYGIKGDKFYGGRVLYKDDETSSEEMKNNYLNFTYLLLNDLKNNGIELSPIAEDFKTDSMVNTITLKYANKLANLSDKSILECSLNINHFGFNEQEVTVIIESVADTLVNNHYSSQSIDNIKTILSNVLENEKYDIYKTVCEKVYIKDYILNDSKDGIEEILKLNYIGFIFMPKEEVIFKNISFRFVVDGGYGANVELKQKTQDTISSIVPMENVDVTWYNNGDYRLYESGDIECLANTFTAINLNNTKELENAVSIYSLLENGTFSNYFNEISVYSASNLVSNIKTNSYVYLECSSEQAFNFAEYLVDYE